MSLIEEVEAYNPYDELEAAEKAGFLQFLHAFGDNVYSRDNKVGHLTPSCWIINSDRTKALMINHKLRNTWSWLGGHADGDSDLLKVAIKEAREESGLKNIKVLTDKFFDISVLPASNHIKNNRYVSSHIHYCPTFLFEADEHEPLLVNENETYGITWIEVDKIIDLVPDSVDKMLYGRLIKKVKEKRW